MQATLVMSAACSRLARIIHASFRITAIALPRRGPTQMQMGGGVSETPPPNRRHLLIGDYCIDPCAIAYIALNFLRSSSALGRALIPQLNAVLESSIITATMRPPPSAVYSPAASPTLRSASRAPYAASVDVLTRSMVL